MVRRSKVAERVLAVLRNPPLYVSMTTAEIRQELKNRGFNHEYDPISRALFNLRNMGLIVRYAPLEEDRWRPRYALKEWYERLSIVLRMNEFIEKYIHHELVSSEDALMLEYLWARGVATVYSELVEILIDEGFRIPEEYQDLHSIITGTPHKEVVKEEEGSGESKRN